MRSALAALTLAYVAASGLGVWLLYRATLTEGLDRLADAGAARVEQAAERLVSQLDPYRAIVNLLARDPRVRAALPASEDGAGIGALLTDHALAFGAAHVELVDREGRLVAASESGVSGGPYKGVPLFSAAMNGRLGLDHVLDGRSRVFRLARGVLRGRPPPQGAVILSVDVAELEFDWAVVPETVVFFDAAEVVFVANRPSLLLRRLATDGPDAFPAHRRDLIGGHDIWRFGRVGDLPREALATRQAAPRIGMTAYAFLDTAPARSAARLSALLAGALAALVALAALLVALWRRRMADRLAIEAAANARLEARVEERTAELRATQHQLIQASKMTALGQMSAGISHEVNQPLAALMNFAENGAKLLDRGRTADARSNFSLISAQAQRISRIISHLRGFSRSEREHVEPVDLVRAVEEALALTSQALTGSGARLDWAPPGGPVMVMGGAVRLQQVAVNLIANALDAMADAAAPALRLSLAVGDRTATLTVRDNGPGVAEPARVFEPFYSTKELGASKGLGLGLSISYGIIGSFGGQIRCRNNKGGGASFDVILPLAAKEPAP